VSTASARAAAKNHRRRGGQGVRSREARSVALNLLDYPPEHRRTWLRTLSEREREYVFAEVERETGTLYGLWHDDPVGFIYDVLEETCTPDQERILSTLAAPGVKRVAVPAGFGVGKTFISGRLTAWAGATRPIGAMQIVTIAPQWRQVREQLWPHIKTAVAKGGLPGKTDTMQWVAKDPLGNLVRVAYGFAASPNDEAAMQGIHANPELVLIVDESGGIAPSIGKGTNNLLTGNARMLAIGNPAMNDPGSWLEGLALRGADPEVKGTELIQISALDSPAITGVPTPICTACVPNLDGHTIAQGINGESHLPSWDWLFDTLHEYGVMIPRETRDLDLIRAEIRESGQPYLIAKVLAEFPKDTGGQVIPASWVEGALAKEDPLNHDACDHMNLSCTATELAEGYVRLCDLGLEDETDKIAVPRGAWVRLGVDVAADGGDEFTIYRMVGDMIHPIHHSAGAQNADPNVVAEKVLDQIDRAQRLAVALGSEAPVRVKVDKNGLGWGVVGNLQRWADTNRHQAQIVGVMVSESPRTEDAAAVMRPYRKRDEMWLAGRFQMQPDPSTGFGRIRLRIDHKAKVQMSTPLYDNNSGGYIVVESKKGMKKRGLQSPDRAEAALLALYEPLPIGGRRRRGLLTDFE
jgi:hypothetical protein